MTALPAAALLALALILAVAGDRAWNVHVWAALTVSAVLSVAAGALLIYQHG